MRLVTSNRAAALIKQLHIRDFTVIEELALEFNTGMTVLTGETGAGKSILIDALGLLLGDRAEASIIRDGRDRAEISALFDITTNQEVNITLAEIDMEPSEPELLLRRVIARDGRSSAYVNGSPVTAQILRAIGEHLIDIHGQHSHQSLTRTEAQRQLLDDYGAYPEELATVRTAFTLWRDATDQLDRLLGSDTDQAAIITLLRYQVEELSGLHPEPGEYESLDEEHRRLANSHRLLETAGKALRLLQEDDDSIQSRLSSITAELKALQQFDSALGNLLHILADANPLISEASMELRHYLDSLQIEPERLTTVEARLSQLHSMARKYKIQPQELPEHLIRLEQQLSQLENSQQSIADLRRTQDAALSQYQAAAAKLHQRRDQAARGLSAEVSTKLAELGMPGGKFAIAIDTQHAATPKVHGGDQVSFQVSTNPGLGLQPLRKIASGGELSRISLAIQVIGTQDQGIPTLIFDEVDAGIGGAIAEIVGKLLHKLARQRQVFCVTHLPQVASQGDHHLQVNKTSTRTSTKTTVQELTEPQRIEEIARMLGGVKITEQSRRHAVEMLHGPQKLRN